MYILRCGTSKKIDFLRCADAVKIVFLKSDPVEIGGVTLQTPKRLRFDAQKIRIGKAIFDFERAEDIFIQDIKSVAEITYKVKTALLLAPNPQ